MTKEEHLSRNKHLRPLDWVHNTSYFWKHNDEFLTYWPRLLYNRCVAVQTVGTIHPLNSGITTSWQSFLDSLHQKRQK